MIGWSDFSEPSYILAAYIPDKPKNKPFVLSVDASQITLSLTPCSNNNGDIILEYVLFM